MIAGFALALLLVITAVGAGCGSADPVVSVDSLVPAAVGVEASGCSLVSALGSGVVLGPGRVVTSAHTVAGAHEVSVIDSAGESHGATLVAFDPDVDLAVLAVDDLDREPLPVGPAEDGASGWVLAWNRDEGVHAKPMSVTKRILVNIEDIYIEDVVQRRAVEIEADVSNGDSGGAIVTTDGVVVGVIYATSRSRNAGFGLDESEIADLLAAAGSAAVDSGPCT